MNITVCIKQVPDVDDIKWTKENNLDRSLMLSRLNEQDEWALDYAAKIKSQFSDVHITAISMGPSQAQDILNYALAKGADRAILLCDKSFAGSDTLATSKILACAIKKYIGEFDLILTGQAASDGDTAQVPVCLAQMLDIVDITNAIEIYNADKTMVIAAQKLDCGINVYEAQTPCLIAVKKECDKKYHPKINDYIRAQNTGIEVYSLGDMDLSNEETGIKGSPTVVYKAFRPSIEKNAEEINQNEVKFILEAIYRIKN